MKILKQSMIEMSMKVLYELQQISVYKILHIGQI